MASAGVGGAEGRWAGGRRAVGLWLGPLAFVAVLLAPLGLSTHAHRTAALVSLMLVYWVTEAVPVAATGLAVPVLAVAAGLASPREAIQAFGEPVLFLLLGAFLLAEAMRVHGLDRRVALWLLMRPGASASSSRARMVVGVVTAALAMWIDGAVAVAMILPLTLGLVRSLMAAGSKESPRGTLLTVGIAASLGGIATPLGSTSNLAVTGLLERLAGRPVGVLGFTAVGLPLAIALLGVAFLVVRLILPGRGASEDPAIYVAIARERGALPAWGPGQTACSVAFGLAAVGWLLPAVLKWLPLAPGSLLFRLNGRLDEAAVALGVAALLFAWPLPGRRALLWEEGVRIDWGTLLLFGGGLTLARLVFDSGLAIAAVRGAVSVGGVSSLWGLTAAALALTMGLTQFTPNAATVSLMAPVVLALAKDLHVSPVPPVLAVCFGASMGFMLPLGAPASALVYGTGLVPIGTMMKIGAVMDALSFVLILAALRLLCPLLGLA
jgi:solute carrier family 13 (sodium-dependent dicarboxylate transporter), member 2/3/5